VSYRLIFILPKIEGDDFNNMQASKTLTQAQRDFLLRLWKVIEKHHGIPDPEKEFDDSKPQAFAMIQRLERATDESSFEAIVKSDRVAAHTLLSKTVVRSIYGKFMEASFPMIEKAKAPQIALNNQNWTDCGMSWFCREAVTVPSPTPHITV